MFIAIATIAALGAAAVIGTFVITARDGYHRVPTRHF
jgi:hypothetical protein